MAVKSNKHETITPAGRLFMEKVLSTSEFTGFEGVFSMGWSGAGTACGSYGFKARAVNVDSSEG